MDPIQEYVTTIMRQAKLDTLPGETRTLLEEQLMVLAYRRIGMLVLQELGQEGSDEFMQLIERDPEQINHDEINAFLTKRIDRFDVKLKEALGELAASFLEKMHATHA